MYVCVYCECLCVYVYIHLHTHRYIQLLKEDSALRRRLGANGRTNVQHFTSRNVVLDMLGWYRRGMQRRRERSLVTVLLLLIPLLMAIPFAVVALFCYDCVVSIVDF